MANDRSYRDLMVWQKSMDLVEHVYRATQRFPKEETYGLKSQIRRSSVSIPSNIAEGQSRLTPGEFIQFLGIARGSLAELETQLLLAQRLTLLAEAESQALLKLASDIGRLLNGLVRPLTTDH
ncbi:MAG TPA: four helix bundle protein [Holophaga sp.]|nr:four helix bundle protein [Holophaga sp.]